MTKKKTSSAVGHISMLDWALRYAKRGWPVFPLKPRSKEPLGLLAPNGFKNATIDPETIRAWWKDEPEANIGIPTGAGTFDVLDVDPRNGGADSLSRLASEHSLPDTLTSHTGGGGKHIFFKHSRRKLRSACGLLPGIDLKSDGGYIVAPPSLHPNGRRYEWTKSHNVSDTKLAKQPGWLLKLRQDHRSRGSKTRVGRFDMARVSFGVHEGYRDVALFRFTCRLRAEGVPRHIAEELVLVAAARCTPPFPEQMALAKVANVYRRYKPGSRRRFGNR